VTTSLSATTTGTSAALLRTELAGIKIRNELKK
jgi:hypothetical protein